jgi:hypothetical protein
MQKGGSLLVEADALKPEQDWPWLAAAPSNPSQGSDSRAWCTFLD